MTLQELDHSPDLLLLKSISGSRAYGLHTPQSDTDIKGVYILPQKEFYGLTYTDQVHNETNDIMYYELKRFMELLYKNNPNIIELLNSPEDCIQFRHPIMDLVKPEMFLSKLCKQTFAGYAFSQIKKAKGLNKKILNPVGEEKKTVLDFCYVVVGQGTMPLQSWLTTNAFSDEGCGLVHLSHTRDMYALYHENQRDGLGLKGIMSGPESDDVRVSSVPKGLEPLVYLSFNKDGYSSYCKEYREYWEWVEKRNENRYEGTKSHGKNYDAKNMMHTFRLLAVAEEIAKEKRVNVRRVSDRDFLLKIKAGAMEYDDLLRIAMEKIELINELFEGCDLPEEPDGEKVELLLCEMREHLYCQL
jgi:uncharacterized protein